MALSNELISQFVKATKGDVKKNNESTSYGKIVKIDGKEYVKLDGAPEDLLTPVSSTTVTKNEDRVIVTVKNHEAIVTGNLSSPSASDSEVKDIGSKITEFEILIGNKIVTEDLEAINAYIENIKGVTAKYKELEAITAEIETLQAKYAEMEYIKATDADLINAQIESLRAKLAEFQSISTEDIDAINAELTNLVTYNAKFTYVSVDTLDAIKADIKDLDVNKLDVETANTKYANIDFSNIENAAIEELFAKRGLIENLEIKDGKITGQLIGVTISGDLIEGNTVKADKLVVLGEDGLYYKLNIEGGSTVTEEISKEDLQNGLDGSNIIANTITADKISVNDLVAFGATIGGYHINSDAIYSGTKESISNTTQGVFLGDDGQVNIGNSNNFLKFFIDTDGVYKLQLQADSIRFGSSNKTIDEAVDESKLKVTKNTEGSELVIEDGSDISNFKIYGKSHQEIIKHDENVTPPITCLSRTVNGLTITNNNDGSITVNGTCEGSYYTDGEYTYGPYNVYIPIYTDESTETTPSWVQQEPVHISASDYITESKIYTITGSPESAYNNGSYMIFEIDNPDSNRGTGGIEKGHGINVYLTPNCSFQCYIVVEPEMTINETFYPKITIADDFHGIPTPNNPSDIKSVGTYNETDGKYIINITHKTINKDETYEENAFSISLNNPLRGLTDEIYDFYQNDTDSVIRKIGSVIFDGSEDWQMFNEDIDYDPSMLVVGFHLPYEYVNKDTILCSHFIKNINECPWYNISTIQGITYANNSSDVGGIVIHVDGNIVNDVDSFKTWLSENPVEMLYELSTPVEETIESVNIPFNKGKTNIYYIDNFLTPKLNCVYDAIYTGTVDELGNLLTDKDISESIDNLNARIDTAESIVEQLSNMISHLVTDANGESLMTQTSDGWTFNMSDINGNLNAIKDAMLNMKNDQGESNSALEKLAGLVNDVANKTAYITMARDENGDPCIELGKTDSLFKVRITNKAIDFLEGSTKIAYANNNTFYSETIIVKENLQIGPGPGFSWSTRENGNCGLIYIPAKGELKHDIWERFFKIKSYNNVQIINNNPTLTFNIPMGDSVYVNLSTDDQNVMEPLAILNPGETIALSLSIEGNFQYGCGVGFYIDGEYVTAQFDVINTVRTYMFTNTDSTLVKNITGIYCSLYGNDDSDTNIKITIDSIYIIGSVSNIDTYLWNKFFRIKRFNDMPVINNNPTLTFSGTTVENKLACLTEENLAYKEPYDGENDKPSIVLKSGEVLHMLVEKIETINIPDHGLRVDFQYNDTYHSSRLWDTDKPYEACVIKNNNNEDMEIRGPYLYIEPNDDTGYSATIRIVKFSITQN